MARASKKSVYERIEDKLQGIKEAEELLANLNEELQTLYVEKDDLEMRQLLEMMKSKGLTIDQALAKFESESQAKETKVSKPRNKKSEEVSDEIVE